MKLLQPNQPVTIEGALPSRDILEVLQTMARDIAAANAKLAAIAAIPVVGDGGDSGAREVINSIIEAAGS